MAKKTFTNATMNFISAAEEPAQEPQQEAQAIPAGFKLVKESKTARVQLLIRPTTKKALQKEADKKKISFNELVNQILESYLERGNR